MTVSEFSAVVTDIRLESREGAAVRWRMTLSHTEFAAGDVGVLHAVSRGGTRIEVPVLAVVADEAPVPELVEELPVPPSEIVIASRAPARVKSACTVSAIVPVAAVDVR